MQMCVFLFWLGGVTALYIDHISMHACMHACIYIPRPWGLKWLPPSNEWSCGRQDDPSALAKDVAPGMLASRRLPQKDL